MPAQAEEDGLGAWVPTGHVGDTDGVSESWFWRSLALAIEATWDLNECVEDCVCLLILS